MQNTNFDPRNVYEIGEKTYTQAECEAVYLFWKTKLEEADIREDITAILENAGNEDIEFTRWIEAHIKDCVDAVARSRRQEEMFQSFLRDGGDGTDSLAATEGCLRDLFAHSGRNPA